MKKSILFSCTTAIALSAGIVQAQEALTPVAVPPVVSPVEQVAPVATVSKPTAEEIKTAYIQTMLSMSPLAGQIYDLNTMKVEQTGDDFLIILTGIPQKLNPKEEGKEAKIITLPDLKIPLTYAGAFNGQAQYRIGNSWESLINIMKTVFPEITITAEKADVSALWSPAYRLRTQNSTNIQKFKTSINDEAEITVDSIISDSLANVVGADKMDAATAADIQNLVAKTDDTILTIPSITIKQQINGSPITGDTIEQIFGADKTIFEFGIPTVLATMVGNPEPLFTMALKGNGSFKDNTFKYDGAINNIHIGGGLPIPSLYIPTEGILDFEVENFTKAFYEQIATFNALLAKQQNILPDQEEALAKAANDMLKDLVVKINHIEVKNSQAGLSLHGILKAEKTETDMLMPGFTGEVVITNLDRISPVPTVDEIACQNAKKNAVSMDKGTADQMVAFACTPRGGMLDMIRPFLKPGNRTVAADGSTTDKIEVKFGIEGLQLNGIQVQ